MIREHPFAASLWNRALLVGLALLAVGVQCLLLAYYTSLPLPTAFADSLFSILFLGMAAYGYGFVADYFRMFLHSALLAFGVQVGAIGITFIGVYLTDLEKWEIFAPTIPLRFLIGLLGWIILAQWYRRILSAGEGADAEGPEPAAVPSVPESSLSYPDHLSVKDGSRIHIVPLADIVYLQASGDYVTVVTSSGQYLKEQTMKYFEAHLPPGRFIRVHRSYIVNAAQIVRIELFGKENYRIRLHNGATLRASSTGYKLLKERLAL